MTEGSAGATLVVDSREPEAVHAATLAHPDVSDWREAHLAAADLVVNGVGFERKTPSDFAASILEGRLDEQVTKLTDAYDHAYVLLEGGFPDFEALGHTRLKPASARGKAASVTARHGLPVIPAGETASLVDMATRLGRKHTAAPTSTHLPTGALGTDEPPGKRMLACIPGVGPRTAESLYREFESVAAVVAATEAELTAVDGVGPKTAAAITEAIQ
jgi:ERCC4-type nuclease